MVKHSRWNKFLGRTDYFVGHNSDTAVKRGHWAESLALEFLLRHGLKLLARNFHARCGEIDLVMEDSDIIVFCEVRYRADQHQIHALETIDARKRTHIIKTSQLWLQAHPTRFDSICRFDVIVVSSMSNNPVCQWIKNAFQA